MTQQVNSTYPILMRGLARDLIEYFRKREEVNSNLEETAPTITGEKLVTTETDQQPTLAAVLSTAFPECPTNYIIDEIEDDQVCVNGIRTVEPNFPLLEIDTISITLNAMARLREREKE